MKLRYDGYTLLELLVTIVIAGILASLAVPSLAPLRGKQDFSQGTALVEDSFRTAQSIAISRSQTVHLFFDPETDQRWICPQEDCTEAEIITLPDLPDNLDLVGTSFVDSTQIALDGLPEIDNEVAFDYQGKVLDRGDILGRIVVAYQGYAFTPQAIYLGSLTATTWVISEELPTEEADAPQ